MKFRLYLFFILLFLLPLGTDKVFAQNYPIQLTTQLLPPFSGYLDDYTQPSSDNLRILLLQTDLSEPSYDVKLKIKIEGQGILIQSKNFYYAGPFNLQPGIPTQISGIDLIDLLNPNNLDFNGISRADYETRKILPEGFYKICITAYDYKNPIQIPVSNESCANGWMVLSEPPFLNMPICGTTLKTSDPQQITFQWTSMNLNSPNSQFQTEYEFSLYEVRPAKQNPNNIVQTLPPLFQTITNTTMLNYSIAEPALVPGMEYVWRVRAMDQSGRDYFKNKGYSEICTFTYGSIYDNIQSLTLQAQPRTHRSAKLWWDNITTYKEYHLEYRKAGNPSYNWFEVNTTNFTTNVYDLEPLTKYEARVRGVAPDGFEGEWSNTVNFTTPSPAQVSCGDLPTVPPIPAAPLQIATTQMIWQIGQFEMIVTKLYNTQSPVGQYSGLGRIHLPFGGMNLGVGFTNITVDETRRVLSGEVVALSEGVDEWITQNTIGEIHTGKESVENQLDIVINGEADITTDGNGNISITGSNGEIKTLTNDQDYGTTIEDSSGKIFIITPDGKVIEAGKAGKGLGAIPEEKNVLNTKYGSVTFKPHAEQFYGYDKYEHTQWNIYYKKVKDEETGEEVTTDWKSIQAKKYDVVELNYNLSSNKIKADSILIISGTGTIYYPKGSGNTRTVYITGSEHGDVQELFAACIVKDELLFLGKLHAVSYALQEKQLTLIPLQSTNVPAAQSLEKELNESYRSSLVKWKVNVAAALMLEDKIWDKDNNQRLNCGSSLLSGYSTEMKALNSEIKNQNYYNRENYFILFTDKQPDSLNGALLGEMPRGRNVGYIFPNAGGAYSMSYVIAHELGHGLGALEHSFSAANPIPQNTTNNLMDYNQGLKTAKWQWDYLHKPPIIPGVGEDEGDAALSGATYNFQQEAIVISPAGKAFKIPAGTKVVFRCGIKSSFNFPNGAIAGFVLPNNKTYLAKMEELGFVKIPVQDADYNNFSGYYEYANGAYLSNKYNNTNFVSVGNQKITLIQEADNAGNSSNFWIIERTEIVNSDECNSGTLNGNTESILLNIADETNDAGIKARVKYSCGAPLPNNGESTSSQGWFTLKDYSSSTSGGSSQLNASDKEKLTNVLGYLGEKMGGRIKLYVINTKNPGYNTQKATAAGDKSDVVCIASTDEKGQLTAFDFAINIPWFDKSYDDCVDPVVEAALNELKNNVVYQASDLLSKITYQVGTVVYKGFFAQLYCATSEEACMNKSEAGKYLGGAVNSLISNFDVEAIIKGVIDLTGSTFKAGIDANASYFQDIKWIYKTINSKTSLVFPTDYQEIFKRLSPPSLRLSNKLVESITTVSNTMWKFYVSEGNWYRNGELTVMAVPLIVTGGQWIAVKGGSILPKFLKIGKKADETATIIADAVKQEKKIINETDKITIKDADGNIEKIIEKVDGEVVVKNGSSILESVENLISITWKNNIKGHLSSTDAQAFWSNTSKNFKHYLDGDFYLKSDEATGNLLFANHKTGEILGFYEGASNAIIMQEKGLAAISAKLKIYHGVSGSASYVSANLSSGAKIISNPNKTATVVGNYTRYPYNVGDMKTIVGDELLGDLKTQQFTAKKGGFNVLNISDDIIRANGGYDAFWENFNKPWLEEAMRRGDDIWVASNPMEIELLFKDISALPPINDASEIYKLFQNPAKWPDLTGYGKEVKILIDNGFKYDPNLKMFKR